MNVFIIGTALETAKALDRRRLNKQIIECQQMLDAMEGETAWSNHPCTLQYVPHKEWLYNYMLCLKLYRFRDLSLSQYYSSECEKKKPQFHTEEFFTQMKRRLYQKNEKHYQQWSHLGKSLDNWYYIDGAWRVYNNGKLLK